MLPVNSTFIDNEEIHHHGPLATQQQWKQYTENEHAVWKFLYKKQWDNLQAIAYRPWLTALNTIGVQENNIPNLGHIADALKPLTHWTPVPVSGFLTPRDYFFYLANRQFPTVVDLRPMDKWDFQVEPDLFHDAFGHLPMHTDPVFADFLHYFGKIAYQTTSEKAMKQLERLYWFTVEYGLILEEGKIKVCGSGHMSGFKEAQFSLTDAVIKRPFHFDDVINQDYNPHVLQTTLFVMESYEEVYEVLRRW